MDSEEDYMSALSSDDEIMQDDLSDDISADDGTSHMHLSLELLGD